MLGYIPLGLIMASNDPYGPTGEFAGDKPSLLFRLRSLRLFRARRPVSRAALRAEPAQCGSRA